MSSPTIHGFVFDDDNIDKLAAHGLQDWQVDQLLDREHRIVPNRRQRRGRYIVIGLDAGGTCLAVPVEPTPDPVIWRPVTGWACKDSERARLRK